MMLPMVLISLDGWGHSDEREGNAIAAIGPGNMHRLARDYPSTLLVASGEAVGLPDGQMGNSEVGHTTLGAGRVMLQELLRISRAVESGEIEDNEVLARGMDSVASGKGSLHLLGLTSDGGVHSHIDHARALVRMAQSRGVEKIWWHAFLDGRDTPPRSAIKYAEALEGFFRDHPAGRIATVMGRFYGMDRDNRWERTEMAYRAMTEAEGIRADDFASAVRAAYDRDEDDEFVRPTVVDPDGIVRDGDAILFFNFRADRARQITRAFTQEKIDSFERRVRPDLASYVCMTRYDQTFDLPVAFPPGTPEKVFGEVVSEAGLKQLRIAETEKYAHVTFFYNGGAERRFPGEDRLLIPSPKVATYDKVPEMSAGAVTEALLERLRTDSGKLVVILNFANADMVGHTGDYDATVHACRYVDDCVGKITGEVLRLGGSLVITADHGNAEQMLDPLDGGVMTAHSTNPVPAIIVTGNDSPYRGARLRPGGSLADVAPTMLSMLKLPQPAEMTGRSLFEHEKQT